MALPGNRDDREFEKFKQVGSEPAVMVDVVRTVGGGGGGSSATEYTDDSSFTVASDKGNAMGGIFTTDSIDSGDFGVFKINADRELSVVVENAGSIGSGSQYTDGTTVAAQVGNVVLGTDGTDLQFLSVASNGQLKVDSITNAVAVTQSGTWNIGTVTTLTTITNDVSIDDGGNSITVDDGGTTLSVDDAGGSLTVDGTVSATQSGTWNIGTLTTLTSITNPVDVNLSDGAGTSIGSTGGALDINIASGTLAVTIDESNDSILVYGWDGSSNQKIKTDVSGNLQVDVLTQPALSESTDDILVYGWDGANNKKLSTDASGQLQVDLASSIPTGTNSIGNIATLTTLTSITNNIKTNLYDGSGTAITSTTVGADQGLDVNLVGGTVTANIEGDYVDDSAFTVGTDIGLAVGGIFTSDTIDSGDFGVFKLNASRELATTVENTVDTNVTNATLAVTQSGTWNVGLNAGTNIIGKAKITDGTNDLSITAGGEMPISDNGGSITVDGTVGVTEIDTDDLDTGAGTDTQAIMGIAIPGSGGHTLWDKSIKLQDGSGTSISSTANALDVNIAASAVTITADIEGDYVDDSAFTVTSDKGLAVGGVFTTDTINSGDFGVFKLNADRELGVFVGEALPTGSNVIGAVTQSGTWDISDISGTISLPTGAATAAKQLADGHNVTVDNASGASAVNIQDGGNSITIDATALPLPTGAATEVTLAAVETDTGSIDTKLTTTNTKLTDIETNTDALAGVTSTGTALDVNVASGTIIANIEGDYVDDSAFAVGSDKGLMVGGFFTTDTIDSGDFGAFKINADRELGVFLGEAIPTGSNVIGAVTQSGTWNVTDISGTISLPTGAATEATLSSIDTDTTTIATKVTDIETNTDALATVTKTTVGADTGLDVNVIKGINVEVDLDAADDSVLVYGYDGSSNQKIKTDSSGNVQVDVVASLPTGTNSIGDIATVATVTTITNDVSIDDGGNSITVDNSTLSVVGGGTEAAAQRVTLANNSTGVLSVDDNGGSLTVDGTVAATQSGAWTVSARGRITPYTEQSAGLPQNSIAWNSAISGPILTKFRLLGITCKFGGIPTANDFIVSLGSLAAPLANVTYWSVNPGTLGVTDLSWHPDGEIIIDSTIGESLDIIWTNAVAQVDWGLRVVVEEVTP